MSYCKIIFVIAMVASFGYGQSMAENVIAMPGKETDIPVADTDHVWIVADTAMVTFECPTCQLKNKFVIAGVESHTFRNLTFPFKYKLATGNYVMTYWQNRVRQIQLPFVVVGDSDNIVKIK